MEEHTTAQEHMMNYKVSIVIEKDEAGYFAYSPELPGCYSQGRNYEAAVQNIKEAVDLYLETLDPDERVQYLSKQISTSSVEVVVA